MKISASFVEESRKLADRWYVTNGAKAVGPVNLELLTRGIEAGKVPLGSFIRHEGWKVWKPLTELAQLDTSPPPSLAPESRGPESRGPDTIPSDDISSPGRPLHPDELAPGDALAGAADIYDALLLALSAAVRGARADAALLFRVTQDGAVAVCAHGPAMVRVLGTRVTSDDAAYVAARAGLRLVPGEPAIPAAAEAVRARVRRLGVTPADAIALPLRASDACFGWLELGRASTFAEPEVRAAEAIGLALEQGIATQAWA